MGQTKSKPADPIVVSGSNPLNNNSNSQKNNEVHCKKGQFSPEVDLVKKKIQTSMDDKMRAVDDFDGLINRLQNKDPTLTEVILCNSNVVSQRESNFKSLVEALRNNTRIVTVELVNVNMKDNECAVLMMCLKTCTELVKLNVESNSLSSVGIEMVACMAEKHPSLQELRVANQRLTVGIEAERALANCLSQNTNIVKLSHRFIEKFVQVYVDKYIQRNIDLKRQKRVASARNLTQLSATSPPQQKQQTPVKGGKNSPPPTATQMPESISSIAPAVAVPYPFPKRDLLEQVAASLHSEELLKDQNEAAASAHWEEFQKTLNSNNSTASNSNNSSSENVLNNTATPVNAAAGIGNTNNTPINQSSHSVKSSSPRSLFFSFGSSKSNNNSTAAVSTSKPSGSVSPRVATAGGRGIQSTEQPIDGNNTANVAVVKSSHDYNTNSHNMEDVYSLTSSGYCQTKNAFETIITRLQKHDITLTEIQFNHSKLLSAQKEKNFILFNDALNNSRCHNIITNIELVHVEMKDKDFLLIMEGLSSCIALEKINVESNYLSSLGIELVAEMAEKHPSLQEIRVSNQRMAVGVEAERALANCLSQNTNIVKISHTFTEKYVIVLVDKYIQRNIEIQRRLRVSTRNKKAYIQSKQQGLVSEPYPFPKRDIFAIMSLHSNLVASNSSNRSIGSNNNNTATSDTNTPDEKATAAAVAAAITSRISTTHIASVKDLISNMSTPHEYINTNSSSNNRELPKKLRQSKLNSMNIIKPQRVYSKGKIPTTQSKTIMKSSNETNGTGSTDEMVASNGSATSTVDRDYLINSHTSVYSGISSDNDNDNVDNNMLSSPLSSTDDYDVDSIVPIITVDTVLLSPSSSTDDNDNNKGNGMIVSSAATPEVVIGSNDNDMSVMITMDEAKLRESLLSLNDSHHELMKTMHNSKLGSTFVTNRNTLSSKGGGSNGFSARHNNTYLSANVSSKSRPDPIQGGGAAVVPVQ